MSLIRLLYIEDDREYAELIRKRLTPEGFETEIATTPGKASKLFREFRPDIAMVDLDLQKEKEGLDIIREIHCRSPWFPVIVYSAHAEPEIIIETMQTGVMHHVGKDRSIPELIAMLRNALHQAYRCKGKWNPKYQLSTFTTFNIANHTLIIGEKTYQLKHIAGAMMQQLCLHINEFVPPAELSIAIWGIEKNVSELRRYITQLRQIIEKEDPDIRLLNQAGGYYQLECKQWQQYTD